MAILLFLNLKGGVAKTTTAVAVAETLADSGQRVLVIDADHQCAASRLLLGEPRLERCEQRRLTLHDLFAAMLEDGFGAGRFDTYVQHGASNIGGGIPTLSALPCSLRIEDFSINLAKGHRGYRPPEEWNRILGAKVDILRHWMSESFDCTIIDCPPGIPFHVRTLLKCADAYIIPTIPDRLSLLGSAGLIDRMRRTGIKRPGLGTLWTLFRANNEIHQQCVRRASWQSSRWSVLPKPFSTVIPNATAIARASEAGTAPGSLSAKYEPEFARLFVGLCREIKGRLNEPAFRSAAGSKAAPVRNRDLADCR